MSSLVSSATPAHFDGSVGVPQKMLTGANQTYKQSSRFYIEIACGVLKPTLIRSLFCCDREATIFQIGLQPGLLEQSLGYALLFDMAIAADHFGKPGQP